MLIFRKTKDFFKKYNIIRKIWEIGQIFGIDILPRHFYSSIPDLRELTKESYWRKPYSMFGIKSAAFDEQVAFIKKCCDSEYLKSRLIRKDIYSHASFENREKGFGSVEGDFLFCFIYSMKPKKIVQVGCGISTAIILLASKEANYKPEIICIEPYPNKFLRMKARDNEITLIAEKAQKLPLDIMTNLGNQGMLFVDSTHTVKPGSEVNVVILEVLPRLSAGSYVHFHDILFPYDYPRLSLTKELFFSNETVLLYAFLINNNNYVIKASLSMLHYARRDELKAFLPDYRPANDNYGLAKSEGHFPSSIYLQVV